MKVTDNPPTSITATATDNQVYTFGQTQILRMTQVLNAILDIDGINRDALVIVFITGIIESQFRNLSNVTQYPNSANFPDIDGDGSDGTSLGIFQQTPPNGWGTPEQLCTVSYAAQAFVGGPSGPNGGNPPGLLDTSWDDGRTPGEAAQAVQGSAFPDRYDTAVPVANECLDQLVVDDDNGNGGDTGNGTALNIRELGNSLQITFEDGTTTICYPSMGGFWYCGGSSGPGPGPGPSDDIAWPFAQSTITSGFGPRSGGVGSFHEGVDFGLSPAVSGADIYCAADGTVSFSGSNSGFGFYCLVYHGELDGKDFYTNYGHMQAQSSLQAGDPVSQGDLIGHIGQTGVVTGPCLHWETHRPDIGAGVVWNTNDDSNPRTAVDPVAFMAQYGGSKVLNA